MRTFLPLFLRVSCAFLAFFTCLTTVHAAERGAERLPGQLVAHIAVASPEKFITDLDQTLSVALDGIPNTGFSPGMIPLMAMFALPLPGGSWDFKSEVHLLVEARRREEPSVAVIFSAESLLGIAVALGQRDKLVKVGEETVLRAVLDGIRETVHMVELGDGRILATPNSKALLRLKRIIAGWNLPSVTGDGIRLRVDVANILGILATEYELALDELRRQSIRGANSALADIEGGRELPNEFFISTDQIKTVLLGYPAFIDRLIRTGDAIVKSIGVFELTLDVAGEKLRLASSISALDGTPLREHIEITQNAVPPEFLYADMIPENASHYGYYMSPSGLDRQMLLYIKETLDGFLGKAFPEVMPYVSQAIDQFLAIGPNASGGFLFRGNDGEMVDGFFSRWDNTELYFQNVDETVAFLDSGSLTDVMRDFFQMMENVSRDTTARSNMDSEWFVQLAKGELVPGIGVVLERREYGSDNKPYYRFQVVFDNERFIPLPRRDMTLPHFPNIIARLLQRFDSIISEQNGIVVTTIGNVRKEEDATRLNRLFGAVGEGAKSLASKADAVDGGYPRQNFFQMINLLEVVCYHGVQQLDMYLQDYNPSLMTAIERLVKSIDGTDCFVFLYSGARDDSFVMTLDIPARSVNVAARKVIDLADEAKRIGDVIRKLTDSYDPYSRGGNDDFDDFDDFDYLEDEAGEGDDEEFVAWDCKVS